MDANESERLRQLIQAHREEILRIVAAHHARDARLFGSVARGDARPGSDVDILVTFDDSTSLMDRVRLLIELEDLVGVKVEVANAATLHRVIRDDVLREAVPI